MRHAMQLVKQQTVKALCQIFGCFPSHLQMLASAIQPTNPEKVANPKRGSNQGLRSDEM
jgi:hypothetical protein